MNSRPLDAIDAATTPQVYHRVAVLLIRRQVMGHRDDGQLSKLLSSASSPPKMHVLGSKSSVRPRSLTENISKTPHKITTTSISSS